MWFGIKVKGCTESEKGLVLKTTRVERLIFWLTNVPYWMLFVYIFSDWIHGNVDILEEVDKNHLCKKTSAYYTLLSLLVAIISSFMHLIQTQLLPSKSSIKRVIKLIGYCDCYDVSLQKKLKSYDRKCAILSGSLFLYCKWNENCVRHVAIAVPFFLAGVVLKRVDCYRSYLVVHGLWHILSALAAYSLYVS